MAALNSLLGILFIINTPHIPFFSPAEIQLYNGLSFFKKTTDFGNILFVDVSYDNQLITPAGVPGNMVITDRQKLTEFLSILDKNQAAIKAVICDINLSYTALEDSMLLATLKNLKTKVIFPKNNETLYTGITGAFSAEVTKINDALIQYPLWDNERQPTYPMGIYTLLHPEAEVYPWKWLPVTRTDKGLFPSSLTITPLIKPSDFEIYENSSGRYKLETLGDFNSIGIPPAAKDLLIVVGSFNPEGNDIHQGYYPYTYGALAILNTYLMLEHRHSRISVGWLLTVGLLLLALNYGYLRKKMAAADKALPVKERKPFRRFIARIISLSFWNFLFFLYIIGAISYFCFDFPLQLIILNLILPLELKLLKWFSGYLG